MAFRMLQHLKKTHLIIWYTQIIFGVMVSADALLQDCSKRRNANFRPSDSIGVEQWEQHDVRDARLGLNLSNRIYASGLNLTDQPFTNTSYKWRCSISRSGEKGVIYSFRTTMNYEYHAQPLVRRNVSFDSSAWD